MQQDDSGMRKSTMEAEHRVQTGLIQALCNAVSHRSDTATADSLPEQLTACVRRISCLKNC